MEAIEPLAWGTILAVEGATKRSIRRNGVRRDIRLGFAFAAALGVASLLIYAASTFSYLDDDTCITHDPPAGLSRSDAVDGRGGQHLSLWPPGVICDWHSGNNSGAYHLGPPGSVQVVIGALGASAMMAVLAGLGAMGLEYRRTWTKPPPMGGDASS